MSINVSRLASQMLGAAQEDLKGNWNEIRVYAEAEARKIAETIKMTEKLYAEGEITAKAEKLHLRIQKNAAMTVLLAGGGLGILAVEKAINAAIRSIRDTVNTAIGFTLL